jgi:D-arabinose 1-dehydrogenase-like Zn-dependent alcohol dehydrogenase
MDTGKIAVFLAPDKGFEIIERELPNPSKNEILVEVVQANICGSDLHLYRGEMAPGFPQDVVLGHEMVGKIVALGEGSELDTAGMPLKVGDYIAYRYWEPCLHCDSCYKGEFHACLTSLASVLRPASKEPYFVGGFASHYLVTSGRSRFLLPEALDPQVAASANCAAAQIVQGINTVGLKFGETVAVQGCGGLGLITVAFAKACGASNVIAIDKIASRLELAKEFGADFTVNASEITEPKERTKRVIELSSNLGADIVVDVVGRAEVIAEGLRMLKRGGKYLEMGSIVPRDYAKIDASILVGSNQSIYGVSLYPDKALHDALLFMEKNNALFKNLVGKTFSLDEIDRAFKEADALTKEGISVGRVGICP